MTLGKNDTALFSPRRHHCAAAQAIRRGEAEQIEASRLLSGIADREISRWYLLLRFFLRLRDIERVAKRKLHDPIVD